MEDKPPGGAAVVDERTAEAYKQLTLRHKEAKSRAEQYVKTLVIGQKVNIVGGIYSGGQGKVVEVGPVSAPVIKGAILAGIGRSQ